MKRRRHRRNPIALGRGSFSRPLSLAGPAITGAAGALAVNAVVNYAPLPDFLKSGNTLYLTRAGLAILLGLMGPRLPFVGRYAKDAAVGALIVTATDFGKLMALSQGVNLSGLGYVGPGRVVGNGMGRLERGAIAAPGLGAFVPRNRARV